MIYNINKYLTTEDIMQLNDTIKQNVLFKNFNINFNIIRCSYLQSRDLLLIYNYYHSISLDKYNVYNIFNLISKEIILYLTRCNKLIKFINYTLDKNISKMYNGIIYKYYTNKEIRIHKNIKNIDIKRNNIRFIKSYKNNKIYMYSLYINIKCMYIYNIYYNKYNYKIYKIYKKYINLNKKNYIIYKNILI